MRNFECTGVRLHSRIAPASSIKVHYSHNTHRIYCQHIFRFAVFSIGKFIFYANPFIHNITSYHRKRHPMRHSHTFRKSLAYLIPELTVCVTAKKVRCRRKALQHFSITVTPRFLSCKQQRLRPFSWRFACWMPERVSHYYPFLQNLRNIREEC